MQMRSLMHVLALNPQPTVSVQAAESKSAGTPVAVASPGRIEAGVKVESKAGEGVLVPAVTPAVVAQAEPEPGARASAKAVLAVLYSVLGTVVLEAALDALIQPGALAKLVGAIPGLQNHAHEGVTLTLLAVLTYWRNSRRKAVK